MLNPLAVALRTVAGAMPGLVRDLAGLCAVGLMSYGGVDALPARCFITAGLLLIVGILLIALGNRAAG